MKIDKQIDEMNKSQLLTLKEIIANKKFIIPLYQRTYKWKRRKAKKLIEDLVDSFKSNKTKSIGMITLRRSDYNSYDVIDGQQRLITLAITLGLLFKKNPIELKFERDNLDNERYNAINEKYNVDWKKYTTDIDRILRNKEEIYNILKSEINLNKQEDFKNFILNNVTMFCSVTTIPPLDEFFNLNAYKTQFSICDYVRANLISLNSFCKKELMEDKVIKPWIEQIDYKKSIAYLYDDILDVLYRDKFYDGAYKDVYSLLLNKQKDNANKDPDDTNESRINILFKDMLDSNNGFFSEEINLNYDQWIEVFLKLSCKKRLIQELEDELNNNNFSSAKKIDDYQKLKKVTWIDEINKIKTEEIDNLTLSKILNKYSRISETLINELETKDIKLINRYLEAHVFSDINKKTIEEGELGISSQEENSYSEYPSMSKSELIADIEGIGRYIVDRYLQEYNTKNEIELSVPARVNFNDDEDIKFTNNISEKKNDNEIDNGIIEVSELFRHKIKIPVVQRDYCMGARINSDKNDDFLSYLINNFNNNREGIIVSTILIGVEEGKKSEKNIYIFDGQQRTYTIYTLLKFLSSDINLENKFEFLGRKNGLSKYSKSAVENLKDSFKTKIDENIDKNDFKDYLLNKVKFNFKVLESASSAEQFFMDINGGVPLEKYEIFKSCLYKRLKDLNKDEFLKKMENEWLKAFYDFLDIDKEDEKDTEEIVEMRLIEFLCRFFAKREEYKDINAFDCVESKSELVEKLLYLDDLSEQDIEYIENILDYFCKHSKKEILKSNELDDNSESLVEFICKETGFLGNNRLGRTELAGGFKIGYNKLNVYETRKTFMNSDSSNKNRIWIMNRFIFSLTDEKREKLKKYYKWKDLNALIKIYDDDLLIEDFIWSICKPENIKEEKYPYANLLDIKTTLIGGYNVLFNWSNDGYCQSSKLNSFQIDMIVEEEIPAYYSKTIEVDASKRIVRLMYIYDEFNSDFKDKLKDGRGMNLVISNNKDIIKFADESNTYLGKCGEPKRIKDINWKGDDYFYGYIIKYEDGSELKIPLRQRRDAYFINNTNTVKRHLN